MKFRHIVIESFFSKLLLVMSVGAYEVQDKSDAMAYLSRFGYIGKDTASSMSIIDASSVLKTFQHMAGINETGELDGATMKMMNMPRCGNLDLEHEMISDPDNDNSIRRKRYKLSETKSKWRKRELTFRITKFSDQMKTVKPELVERDVAKAFKLWEASTNLNFIRSDAKVVDIELGFATQKHQDAFPFDGPGKTLAHAFSPGPGLGGDVHFDDHEMWSTDSMKGTNVLFVAVHEIGHSLGLSHSDKKGAIMQAFYGGYRPHLKLHEDDIAGIQQLYGKREDGSRKSVPEMTTSNYFSNRQMPYMPMGRVEVTTPPSTLSTTTVKHVSVITESLTVIPNKPRVDLGFRALSPDQPGFMRPDLCQKHTKIDAITTLNDKNIYVFSGYYVFRLDDKTKRVVTGWPKRLEFAFKGLEANVDAAFTRSNGKTYILKGGKFWRFTGFDLDSGYPKAISKHFPGIPDYVDSAFVHPSNEQIYFTKGDNYWRFDPTAKGRPHVQSFYPLPLGVWKVPPTGLDATFTSPHLRHVYFFKGHEYWKFDSTNFKVDGDGYPRPSRDAWFGCNNLVQRKTELPHLLQFSNNYIP